MLELRFCSFTSSSLHGVLAIWLSFFYNHGFRLIFNIFTDCDLTIKRKSIQLVTSHKEKENVSSSRGQVFTVSLGIQYMFH